MFQAKNAEILLATQLAIASTVDHVGKFTAGVAEYPPLVCCQMTGQLWLGNQGTIRQPEFFDIELAGVGKILVFKTHAFSDTAQHHRPGFWERHLQQHIGAVMREIEAPAFVDIMRAKIHAATINDQQKLQGIDQTGLAGVVWSDEGHGAIQWQFGPRVTGAIEQHKALESVLHQPFSSSSALSELPASSASVAGSIRSEASSRSSLSTPARDSK